MDEDPFVVGRQTEGFSRLVRPHCPVSGRVQAILDDSLDRTFVLCPYVGCVWTSCARGPSRRSAQHKVDLEAYAQGSVRKSRTRVKDVLIGRTILLSRYWWFPAMVQVCY